MSAPARVFHRDAALRARAEANHAALELASRLHGAADAVQRAVESRDVVEVDRRVADARRLLSAIEQAARL